MYKEQWKLSKQRDTRVDCSPFSGEIASKLKLLAGFVYTRLPQVVIKIVLVFLHYFLSQVLSINSVLVLSPSVLNITE